MFSGFTLGDLVSELKKHTYTVGSTEDSLAVCVCGDVYNSDDEHHADVLEKFLRSRMSRAYDDGHSGLYYDMTDVLELHHDKNSDSDNYAKPWIACTCGAHFKDLAAHRAENVARLIKSIISIVEGKEWV